MALIKPEYNYIGLEVYLKGFVQLLKTLGENDIDNVRVMRFNAVDVLEHMIPDNSIEGFHIFFPDPWPKKKHHKRRIMNPDFVHLLATKLKKGGYIYMLIQEMHRLHVNYWKNFPWFDYMYENLDEPSLLK